MRKRILMAVCCLALCFFASVSTDGSLIFVSLEEMVQQADLIVIGEVIDITCRRVEDANILIRTYVTFEVEETMKGTSAGGVVLIEFEGGAVKKPDSDEYIVVDISDTPSFFIGKRDVLLLRRERNGRDLEGKPIFRIVGAVQGKYAIAGDKAVQDNGNGNPGLCFFGAWKYWYPEESEESYQAWLKSLWPMPTTQERFR